MYPTYRSALEASGAKVLAFDSFGSYQGDWWAEVELPDGRRGWINGSYGSCSGCDAIEAELGDVADACDTHRRNFPRPPQPQCAACVEAKAHYATRLAEFGAAYLDRIMTQAEAEAKARENIEWDLDASEMVSFISRKGI